MTVVAVTLSWALLVDALGLNFFVDKLPHHNKVSFFEGDTGRYSPASIKEHLKIFKKTHIYQHLSSNGNCFNSCTDDCFSILDDAAKRQR